MKVKTLFFSLPELFFLERAISHSAPRTILAVPPITDDDLVALALKVGFALNNIKNGEDAELGLTEKDCWFFRETVDIMAIMGKSAQGEGFTIKKKLYAAILEFALDAEQIEQLEAQQHEEVRYNARDTRKDADQD